MRFTPSLPRTSGAETVQLTPDKVAVAVTVDASVDSATDVNLNAATTLLEVNALTQGIYMRYQATASAANFDEFILGNSVRHYVVPQGVTVVSFISETAGAKLILIQK